MICAFVLSRSSDELTMVTDEGCQRTGAESDSWPELQRERRALTAATAQASARFRPGSQYSIAPAEMVPRVREETLFRAFNGALFEADLQPVGRFLLRQQAFRFPGDAFGHAPRETCRKPLGRIAGNALPQRLGRRLADEEAIAPCHRDDTRTVP